MLTTVDTFKHNSHAPIYLILLSTPEACRLHNWWYTVNQVVFIKLTHRYTHCRWETLGKLPPLSALTSALEAQRTRRVADFADFILLYTTASLEDAYRHAQTQYIELQI